jgi:aspartate kinase
MLLSTGERMAMSLLTIAIQAQGRDAVSLTGSQCGIITDHRHGHARVMEVRPFRILDELAAGRVVIVGGFQGVSYKREVTTLGRGGSDTTAVALAAALGGDCEIYSDVDGVYSADPRVVASAQHLDELDHAQMRALSRAGAKVLHARAVELAQEQGVAIYARATPSGPNSSSAQTVVRSGVRRETGVRAVACDERVFGVSISFGAAPSVESAWSGLAASLGALGLRHLQVGAAGAHGLLSATQRDDAAAVVQRVRELVRDRLPDHGKVDTRSDLALVSCIGCGLEDRGDLLQTALDALTAAGARVESIHVEADCVSFVVTESSAVAATRALHDALVRGRPPTRAR